MINISIVANNVRPITYSFVSGRGWGRWGDTFILQMLSAPFHFCRPVAFSVKTNVMYDGTLDEETPVHGSAVSFRIGDYLHIFEKFDANWWVGRKVKENSDIGFVPSPDRLEQLILQKAPVGKLDRVKTDSAPGDREEEGLPGEKVRIPVPVRRGADHAARGHGRPLVEGLRGDRHAAEGRLRVPQEQGESDFFTVRYSRRICRNWELNFCVAV